ncbi:MAG: protein phosphatase CheZ [candidate division Zixibacteria bacterium]|nr:protein phosphatase CheZ [candidate division Zixibacteria bacterium]
MIDSNGLQDKLQKEMGELASSIDQIMSKFSELNNPLNESKEKVPRATEQLDKISKQTESATTQMLDKIELIVQRVEESITGLGQIKGLVAASKIEEIEPLADKLIEGATSTRDDAYNLMDALQFQDITSQQMNHAASLLEEIQSRLSRITMVLQGKSSQTPTEDSTPDKKERVYDPHADLFDKKTDQSAIDDLFAKKQ